MLTNAETLSFVPFSLLPSSLNREIILACFVPGCNGFAENSIRKSLLSAHYQRTFPLGA